MRGFCLWISCIIGFFWSDTSFGDKITYLVPLYLTSLFAILTFYMWERFDKENFYLLFLQNRSLLDWQRIIKENIPQSMVFVTRPKKKHSPSSRHSVRDSIKEYLYGSKSGVDKHISKDADKKQNEDELIFNFVNKKFYD